MKKTADKEFPVEDLLRGAYWGANPVPQQFGKILAELSLGMLGDLSAHFRAAVKKSGETAVFASLPKVKEIGAQIATDRKQYPVLDKKLRGATQKFLRQSKQSARDWLKSALRNMGASDADKLIFVEHARSQMSAAVVYHDRLENAADRAKPKPKSRKRAEP